MKGEERFKGDEGDYYGGDKEMGKGEEDEEQTTHGNVI